MDLNDMLDPTTTTGLITSIVSGIVLLGLWLLWRAVRGRLERVLGQTENSHQGTEYPNLRDEVTAIRMLAEQAATTGKETAEAVGKLATAVGQDRAASRAETEGVRQDVRSLTSRLDVHIAASVARQAPPPDGL
jgi:hypothetical protein